MLSIVTASCDSGVAGESSGEVEILVVDGSGGAPGAAGGTIRLRIGLGFLHTSGSTTTITEAPVELTIPVGGQQPVPIVIRSMPGGRYTTARLTFSEVTVSIDESGAQREVQLDTSAGPVIIDKLVNLVVGVTDRETVLIEINSHAWIEQGSGGVVGAVPFMAALNVRVNP